MPLHLEIVTPERLAYSDEVDMVLAQQRECLFAVLGGVHVVAVSLELGPEHAPEIELVVDDQDLLALG